MIESGCMVAILMLEEIHTDKSELGGEPRDDEKECRGAEINDEEGEQNWVKDGAFSDGLSE